MRRIIVLVSAWAGVTLLTAAVAWGVVRLAGSGVTDAALQPLSSAQVDEMGTTAPAAEDAPVSSPDDSGVPGPETSSTARPEAGTSTVSPASTTAPASPSTTTATSPPPTTGATTVPSSTTTAADPTAPSAPTSTTTTVPATTTTSAGPATTITGGTRAFTYPEGTVVVRFDASGVSLVSASPAPGYAVDVDAGGPPAVDLEFEREDDDARFRARLEDGELVVSMERDD